MDLIADTVDSIGPTSILYVECFRMSLHNGDKLVYCADKRIRPSGRYVPNNLTHIKNVH